MKQQKTITNQLVRMYIRPIPGYVRFLCVLLFLYTADDLGAQTQLPNGSITTSGTYRVPAGINSIMVEAWGGGGAGGASNGNGQATGGGGGGAYAKVYLLPVRAGEELTVIIGTGGDGASGGPGGNTYMQRNGTTLILAAGGDGVGNNNQAGGSGGQAANCDGDVSHSGGNGGNSGGTGSLCLAGAGGGGAAAGRINDGNNGGNGTRTGNNGGPGGIGLHGGGSGGKGTNEHGDGGNGSSPGGGGGGGKRGCAGGGANDGGNGGDGVMIVSFCPQYSFTGVTVPSPVCENVLTTHVTITGNNMGLTAGTYSITYNVNGGPDQTANNIVVTQSGGVHSGIIPNVPVPAGMSSVTITITYISTGSCGNALTTNNTVTINRQVSPPKPALSPGSTTVCGTSASLTAVGSYANPSYRWYFNGQVMSQTTASITINQSGNYYVTVTDNGCSISSDTSSYTFHPIATGTMITAPSINVCTDTTATLHAQPEVESSISNPVFRWYSSQNTPTALATGPSFITRRLSNTTANVRDTVFYISVAGDNYCENIPGDRRPVTVSLYNKPTVTITTTQDTICYNKTVGLTASTTGIIDWIGWYNPDNSGSFLPGTIDIPHVTYTPHASAKGKTAKVYASVHNPGCSYVADTVFLQILPKNTTAAMEIIAQPTGFQNVCEDTVYVVKIKATGKGEVNNMHLILHDNNSTGLYIGEANVKRSDGTGYILPPQSPTLLTDRPGAMWSFTEPLSPNDSLIVAVTVNAACEFSGGTSLNFYLDYGTACDNFLERITKPTLPFNIEQTQDAVNTYNIFSRFLDNKGNPVTKVSNNISDTITWYLKASFGQYRLPADSSKEAINVLLPAGLELIPYSYLPIQNAPPREWIVTTPEANGVRLSLPLLNNLDDTDTIIAQFQFTVAGASCNTYEFYAEIDYEHHAICSGSEDSCSFYITQGAAYPNPVLTVERYVFSIDSIYGEIVNDFWYGRIKLKTTTPFYEGDNIYFDFYRDNNNNFIYDEEDDYLNTHEYVTENVNRGAVFSDIYDEGIAVEPGKQFVVVVTSPAICDTAVFAIAPITGSDGADRVCQYDTTIYYTAKGDGIKGYAWDVDVITGATPLRIPAQGETFAGENKPDEAHIVWSTAGEYKVQTQYTGVEKTYFLVKVDQKPVITFTRGRIRNTCANNEITININTVATDSVQWSNYEGTGSATGSTTNTLHYSPFHRTTDTTFYIRITAYCVDGSACNPVTDSVQITIYGTPGFIFADTISCGPANLTALHLISGSTKGVLNFSYWNEDYSTNVSNWATAITQSGIYNIVGNSAYCNDTATVNVRVKPIPELTIADSDEEQAICSEIVVSNPGLSSDVSGTTYNISSISTPGITGNTTSARGLGKFPADTLTTTATVAGSVTYTITPIVDGCEGTSKAYTVFVYPLPEISILGSSTICVGTQTQLSPSERGYWRSNNPSVASVTNDGFVTGTDVGDATFMFTSSTTGCSTTTDTISVDTFPTVDAITGERNVCVNATIQLSCTPEGGLWTLSNTNAQIIGEADDIPVDIKGVMSGQTYVSYIVGTDVCQSTSTFLLEIVPASPPKIIIGFER